MEYITHLRTRRKNEVSEHKCAPDTCVYMGVYIVRVATETEGIAIRTEKQQIYLVYKYIYIYSQLMRANLLGEQTDNIIIPVRTYKKRPLVRKPGKSFYPFPV